MPRSAHAQCPDRRRPRRLPPDGADVARGGGLRRRRRGRRRRVGARVHLAAPARHRPARRPAAGHGRVRGRVATGVERLRAEGRALRRETGGPPGVTTRSALGVWTLALLAAVGAVAIVLTSDHTPDRLATIVLAAPIGLVFVASGLIARGRRPDNRTGSLLVATGLTWFLGALGAAEEPVLFSAGLLLSALSTGVLAHLLLAFPTGKLERRFDRLLIGAGYVLVLAGPAAIAAVDSDVDDCGKGTCPDNVVAVTDNTALAGAFRLVFIVVAVVLLVALIVRLVQRWRTASPALRRALAPVYFTGVGFTVVLAALTALSAFSSELGERLNWITLAAL